MLLHRFSRLNEASGALCLGNNNTRVDYCALSIPKVTVLVGWKSELVNAILGNQVIVCVLLQLYARFVSSDKQSQKDGLFTELV